ncbi:MAG: hypothetical protein A2017_10570 [Lentisphaerae bacterium GWF2_44_16]|nr:MAG: hypothetical protein A2017_10570 [Lentisphaerae bacterium GWF2_44_16]
MGNARKISMKTLERIVLYKRILGDLAAKGQKTLYSHQLAELAHNSPAQVRRDLMITGYSGTPRRGYTTEDLIKKISVTLNETAEQKIALVGIGNLGRAILAYFNYQQPSFSIAAAFDSDETRVDRVIAGCRCYHLREFESKVKELGVTLGIVTVPASSAQTVADMMVSAGIKAILNFAPVPLKVPSNVFADRIDITMALEKIAYLASIK